MDTQFIAAPDSPAGIRVIGFGGPKEHGKDTLAEMVAALTGGKVMGMSDALTLDVITLNPIVNVRPADKVIAPDGGQISGYIRVALLIHLVGVTEAKRVPEVRRFFQALGTDVVRNHKPEAWVEKAVEKARTLGSDGSPVYITGIRFPNELAMVRAFGGAAYWVERPGHPGTGESGHSSENALTAADFDRTVLNDGDLSDLHRKAVELGTPASLIGI